MTSPLRFCLNIYVRNEMEKDGGHKAMPWKVCFTDAKHVDYITAKLSYC